MVRKKKSTRAVGRQTSRKRHGREGAARREGDALYPTDLARMLSGF